MQEAQSRITSFFNKLLMFQIHVLLPFFPDIPAITITNHEKPPPAAQISRKTLCQKCQHRRLCAFSHPNHIFLQSNTQWKCRAGIGPYESQTSKKLE
ncbi:MAG: hypothetical protein ACLT76_02870 [Clostridium fessum]